MCDIVERYLSGRVIVHCFGRLGQGKGSPEGAVLGPLLWNVVEY